jgi:hypothetical protein
MHKASNKTVKRSNTTHLQEPATSIHTAGLIANGFSIIVGDTLD